MTGYTVHIGSTEQFSEGWDRIFAGGPGKSRKKPPASSQTPKTSGKKPANAKSKRKKA